MRPLSTLVLFIALFFSPFSSHLTFSSIISARPFPHRFSSFDLLTFPFQKRYQAYKLPCLNPQESLSANRYVYSILNRFSHAVAASHQSLNPFLERDRICRAAEQHPPTFRSFLLSISGITSPAGAASSSAAPHKTCTAKQVIRLRCHDI